MTVELLPEFKRPTLVQGEIKMFSSQERCMRFFLRISALTLTGTTLVAIALFVLWPMILLSVIVDAAIAVGSGLWRRWLKE